MKNTLETRLGIFIALVVIAAVFILEIVGGADFFRRGKHLKALFANVQDLKVGDRVKMAGVEIGRVSDMGLNLTNNKVELTLKLLPKKEVRSDSVATIKFAGLMGQNYVAVDFGSKGGPLEDGAYITTTETPDISEIMTKLDSVFTGVESVTKSFTGFELDDLLGPLLGFIQDNRAPLTAAISNLTSVSHEMAQGKGTVGKLIMSDELYSEAITTVTNLHKATDQISEAVTDARKLVDQMNSGEGTLGKLLKTDELHRETMASMTNLKEILQKINQGKGTVGKVVNDEDLYKNAKLTLQKLDKATEGLEDQGPLSVMGILINNLF